MTAVLILKIIFVLIIAFDFFMVTPFGVYWTMKNLDDGDYCYGIIIMFVTAIPLMIIAGVLGLL